MIFGLFYGPQHRRCLITHRHVYLHCSMLQKYQEICLKCQIITVMALLIILHGKSWNKYKHFRQKMRHFNRDYFVYYAKLTTPWSAPDFGQVRTKKKTERGKILPLGGSIFRVYAFYRWQHFRDNASFLGNQWTVVFSTSVTF